jgi:hypothetical protein
MAYNKKGQAKPTTYPAISATLTHSNDQHRLQACQDQVDYLTAAIRRMSNVSRVTYVL